MSIDQAYRAEFRCFSDNRNSSRGSVIVLASGPSANEFPFYRFSSLPIIAMNGSIVKCKEMEMSPLFYICDDDSFVRDRTCMVTEGFAYAHNIAMTQSCYAIYHSSCPDKMKRKSLYVLERVNRANGKAVVPDRRYARSIRKDPDLYSGYSLFSTRPNRIGFSANLEKGYFGSRTIPYAGIQLARHLGFDKVFLVGLDLNSSAGRFYEAGKDALASRLDQDYEKYILPSFELMAKKIIEHNKFEVFNLSQKSRLPASIVEKISLEDMERLTAGDKHQAHAFMYGGPPERFAI